jgi:hypothetical protein
MEKFTIVYGLTDNDCKKVDVCCEEKQLETICEALYNYGRHYVWHRPIACTAYREGKVASFKNEYDYMYADCM